MFINSSRENIAFEMVDFDVLLSHKHNHIFYLFWTDCETRKKKQQHTHTQPNVKKANKLLTIITYVRIKSMVNTGNGCLHLARIYIHAQCKTERKKKTATK